LKTGKRSAKVDNPRIFIFPLPAWGCEGERKHTMPADASPLKKAKREAPQMSPIKDAGRKFPEINGQKKEGERKRGGGGGR